MMGGRTVYPTATPRKNADADAAAGSRLRAAAVTLAVAVAGTQKKKKATHQICDSVGSCKFKTTLKLYSTRRRAFEGHWHRFYRGEKNREREKGEKKVR